MYSLLPASWMGLCQTSVYFWLWCSSSNSCNKRRASENISFQRNTTFQSVFLHEPCKQSTFMYEVVQKCFFFYYYYYLILFKFYLFFPEAKFTVYAEMMRNMTGHADTLVLTVSNLPYFMR